MEQQIKQITRSLKIQYTLFWLLPLFLVVAGETELFPVGLCAGDAQIQYIWGTIGVLVAIVCVPLSLKLFSIALKRKMSESDFPIALENYLFWSGIRLGILELAVLLNLIVYYLTLDNLGGLCALIALTASAFCLPGEKRLREELNIASDNN